MLDPRLAQAYKTAETLRYLASYWKSHAPPRMTKEGQILPLMAMEYAPAMMGAGPGVFGLGQVPQSRGLINQWLAKLLGEGPLSQMGRGILERAWTKPVRPSLSFPMVSPVNSIKGTAYLDRLNELRMQYGQSPLPIGSAAGG
jgi:hypothetical protein